MQRQASSARLTIAAIAGGLVFLAFVALTSGAGVTFSPVLFAVLAVAIAVAAFLLSGFHKGGAKDHPNPGVSDEGQAGSTASERDPEQKVQGASFDSDSTTPERDTPDVTPETMPDPIVSDRAEGPVGPPAVNSAPAEAQEDRAEHISDEHASATALAGDPESDSTTPERDTPDVTPETMPDPIVSDRAEGPVGPPAVSSAPAEAQEDRAEHVADEPAPTTELAGDEDGAALRAATADIAETEEAGPVEPASDPTVRDGTESDVVGHPPGRLDSPRDAGADDLKRLRGVGPKLEEELNAMGIYHLDQIAGWTPEELAWVDANLPGFKGRASRDDWVTQARELTEKDG